MTESTLANSQQHRGRAVRGVELPSHKSASTQMPLAPAPLPSEVIVPLEGGLSARDLRPAVETGQLLSVGHALCEVPKTFDLNRKIARQLQEKRKTIDTGENIDWATGEALAWGTLRSSSPGATVRPAHRPSSQSALLGL